VSFKGRYKVGEATAPPSRPLGLTVSNNRLHWLYASATIAGYEPVSNSFCRPKGRDCGGKKRRLRAVTT